MTLDELAREYEAQYRKAVCMADALYPLLYVYRGKKLELLRRRIRFYYEMACECKNTAFMLDAISTEDSDGLYR